MGYYSWLTADTQESIPVFEATHPNAGRTVYLLQPGDLPSIAESAYQGNGVFGGVDVFHFLAFHNLPYETLINLDQIEVHNLGVGLEHGHYFMDKDTGQKHLVFHDYRAIVTGALFHAHTYGVPVSGYNGLSPNDLIGSGRWVEHSINEEYLRVPLKFSFNPMASYEKLPASEVCPYQGMYYEDLISFDNLIMAPTQNNYLH